jgi:hypothetical protein
MRSLERRISVTVIGRSPASIVTAAVRASITSVVTGSAIWYDFSAFR